MICMKEDFSVTPPPPASQCPSITSHACLISRVSPQYSSTRVLWLGDLEEKGVAWLKGSAVLCLKAFFSSSSQTLNNPSCDGVRAQRVSEHPCNWSPDFTVKFYSFHWALYLNRILAHILSKMVMRRFKPKWPMLAVMY